MPDCPIYEFGIFSLNTKEKQLLKRGEPVPLMLKAYEVLALLVRHHGHLVEKDQILKEVWPGRFVEESNVAQNIHHLRKALDEGEQGRDFIETVPGRGYRFIASVKEVREAERPNHNAAGQTLVEGMLAGGEWQGTGADGQQQAARRGRWMLKPKYVIPLLFVFCGVALLAWKGAPWKRTPDPHPEFKSFAVLPFRPLGTEDDELLGMGMADALITRLSNYPQMPVLPTSSVLRFVGREHDPLATGRELNVDAVLSGTVQRVGERVRVTVQLIDVKEKRTRWANTFDEQFTNIFALQDTISYQIVAALALDLTGRAHVQKHHTESVEAYQAYLMGLYFWNKRSKENLAKSIEYLQQSLALDPNYSLAYALMADSYALMAVNGYGPLAPSEAYEKSKDAASKAFKLDNTLAEAYLALALVKSNHENDPLGAEQSLKQAIALKPNHATAHQRYGWHLAWKGQLPAALAAMTRAQQLDPLSAAINSALTTLLMRSRNYDEALRYAKRLVEIDPNSYDGYLNMSEAYELKGMYQESLAALEKAIELDPGNFYTLAQIGRVYALSGQQGKAREVLGKLAESKEGRMLLYGIALINFALKQKDEAFMWLDKAVASGSANHILLRFDPKLDPLRSDPRFAEILRRHNLQRLLN